MVGNARAGPITEWAGMTDWVMAVRDKNLRGRVEACGGEVAQD